MIVQVFIREWTAEVLELVKSLKDIPFVTDVIVSRGRRNQVVADSVKVWDEDDRGTPEDSIYEFAVSVKLSEIVPSASS
ncbi:hypothetical protein HS1genome_0802 [Sulfodiicoccus acidiphilus]|uniref:Uncharacterized protein n=1 Tax=Sulfodiicoccus acidiphilus TaxID=1670455 RepID=A0A348B2L1_9CREN|nr:hypothetical protein [Sulfodiicoccus acidiphilus]BBD72413.1 hypothetical protein HS1genome_0802 [Sulfodiicoccus acidiphilus]GGT97318.1 hypothetical protein GCM10007116_13540 [Sulfodiicoccus acidiphilus]